MKWFLFNRPGVAGAVLLTPLSTDPFPPNLQTWFYAVDTLFNIQFELQHRVVFGFYPLSPLSWDQRSRMLKFWLCDFNPPEYVHYAEISGAEGGLQSSGITADLPSPCAHKYTHSQIQTHMHKFKHTHTHAKIQTYTHTCTNSNKQKTYTHTFQSNWRPAGLLKNVFQVLFMCPL